MAKGNDLTVVLCFDSDGNRTFAEWRYHLPADSRALACFGEPVSVFVKAPKRPGPPPSSPSGCMKVFAGDKPEWQDSQATMDAFRALWPGLLKTIAGTSGETVGLVYFSGMATHSGLFTLWPYMPFGDDGDDEDKRFYVSEVCKESRTSIPAPLWLCFEYSHDAFEGLAGLDGFEFTYGNTIMGMFVAESKVAKYLRKDLLDKTLLDEILRDNDLRCWWLCDADFEGMTIWHKDYAGEDLLRRVHEDIKGQVTKLGFDLEIVGGRS